MTTLSSYKNARDVTQAVIVREKELVRQSLSQAHTILESSNNVQSDVNILTDEHIVAKIQDILIDTTLIKRCLKIKRDKNAPKNAKSAYMFWCQDYRKTIKEKYPHYKMTEVAKELGVQWKKMKAKDKVKYQKLANEDKVRAAEEKAKYIPPSNTDSVPLSSYNHLRRLNNTMIEREKELVRETLLFAQRYLSGNSISVKTLVEPDTVSLAQSSVIDLGIVKRCMKSKKDPNAPKGIRSAYMLWCDENRMNVQEKYPKLKMTDVAKELGILWKGTKDEVKEEFQEKSNADKERYNQEKAAYEHQLALTMGNLTGVGATEAI